MKSDSSDDDNDEENPSGSSELLDLGSIDNSNS